MSVHVQHGPCASRRARACHSRCAASQPPSQRLRCAFWRPPAAPCFWSQPFLRVINQGAWCDGAVGTTAGVTPPHFAADAHAARPPGNCSRNQGLLRGVPEEVALVTRSPHAAGTCKAIEPVSHKTRELLPTRSSQHRPAALFAELYALAVAGRPLHGGKARPRQRGPLPPACDGQTHSLKASPPAGAHCSSTACSGRTQQQRRASGGAAAQRGAHMAELHVIGQVLGASGFQGDSVFCKWGVHAGRSWELLEGADQGQTQTDRPGDGGMALWSHPLDVHYVCRGLLGWPKLHLQIWSQDVHGRNELRGYGFCHVPTAPGTYELDCPTWLPEGSLGERIAAFFTGGAPRLRVEEVVYSPGDRFRLQTVSGGIVHLQLGIVMKDFEKSNVQF